MCAGVRALGGGGGGGGGLGFRIQGSRFAVKNFRHWGLDFGVQGLGFRT